MKKIYSISIAVVIAIMMAIMVTPGIAGASNHIDSSRVVYAIQDPANPTIADIVAANLWYLRLLAASLPKTADGGIDPVNLVIEDIVAPSQPKTEAAVMPLTFTQMVTEAMAVVPALKPAEVQNRQQQEPNTLIIDVRDAADIVLTGRIPGAVNISYGSLTYKADQGVPPEWRDPRLQDRSRPIITVCYSGELGALGAKLLKDMGFTNVAFVEGGTVGWIAAGLPIEAT